MAEQDLLLLQLLKIPVFVIKFLAKILSILTYLPNYLILLVVDHFLFERKYRNSLSIYMIMWVPKVALLFLSLCMFCAQFYGILKVLQLQEYSLLLQISGVVLTLGGLLILMRKGYLSLIQKYNLSKLKSVKEHIQLGLQLLVDSVSITLAVINMVMMVNFKKTWSYQYNPEGQFRYLKHILKSVRESLIIYIQFFYVKIFFYLFPWRFNTELQTYKKQKDQQNVLNCFVLLTLTFFFTLIDIIVVILLGPFNLIHWKRKQFYQKLVATHIKWKVTLIHFCFAVCQTIQLTLQALMFPICWKESINCIKLLVGYDELKDLFGGEFFSLLIKCLIRIPYFFCSIAIFISRYKYHRRNLLVKQSRQQNANLQDKQFMIKNQLIVQYKTFQSFSQLFIDSFFVLPIIIATLIKLWRIDWVKYLLSNDYQLNRKLIFVYCMRNILQVTIILPLTAIFNLVIILYRFKKPLQNYQQATIKLDNKYDKYQKKRKEIPKEQQWDYFQKGSWLACYFQLSWFTLKNDLLHLPLYFVLKITLISIYDRNIQPMTAPSYLCKFYGEYYHLAAKASVRGEFYEQIFLRMKANKAIYDQETKYKFWRTAFKCQKLLLIQSIICFFLRNISIEKIKNRVKKGSNLSQLSNEYWYQYQLTKRYLFRLILLIYQIITSIIGFIILLPLTLWRLPTFVKLYAFHNERKLFFRILFAMYKQMVFDLITLPIKLICLLMAPRTTIKFIIKTAFRYGPQGLLSFDKYQQMKRVYLYQVIFIENTVLRINALQIIFIYITWIRIKSLKSQLRELRLTVFQFFKQFIFNSEQLLPIQNLIQQYYTRSLSDRYFKVTKSIHSVFLESLIDFPYLLLIAVLFITMPWRINYIIQAIKDTRNDSSQRKSLTKLLKSILKDYACILLNILLLLSIFKTRKALFLIRRNYRLNFFIGFLQYSYFNQLKKQLQSLFYIYLDIFYAFIACIFGWTKAHLLVNDLRSHRKKMAEQEQSSVQNKKICENTKKQNKELQVLNKMGFYNYINVCSFLSIPDIVALRSVDKLNYQMSQREQIWFNKWQTLYASKHNFIDEQFEVRCKKAYQLSIDNNRVMVTYHSIIMTHYIRNVFQETVSIVQFSRERLPQKVYKFIFIDYRYNQVEGYGPQNQLPQAENQDQQYLRLTNQVRRPKVELEQNQGYVNLLLWRPTENIVQAMHRKFRVDSDRRKKQAVVVLIIVVTIIVEITILIKFSISIIWLQDSLIGLRLAFLAYMTIFLGYFVQRAENVSRQWVALRPFDLYYDVVRAYTYLKQEIIKKRVINPTSNFLQKIGALIKRIFNKIIDTIVKSSKFAYENMIKPLYIKIAYIVGKVRDALVLVFKKIFEVIRSTWNAIYSLTVTIFTSIYNGIYAIFSNANKHYYLILQRSMTFFLKFGIIGNLLFTIFGLILMTLPSLIWWFFYSPRWYLIVSTIHTMVLIVIGYKHLNTIRSQR